MARKVALAFDPQGFMLPLDQILPMKAFAPYQRNTPKYRCIKASLREVGQIEPLIVFPQKGQKQCLLLDGAIRYDIFKESGETEAFCLKATEEEAVTYNFKVSQLSPIQEHYMILKALQNGVSEARIAATLSVDVADIRNKRDLLTGICQEVVGILRHRRISSNAMREFRRVVPMRQVEMAELMISSNNVSASYARCLVASTPKEQRIAGPASKEEKGLTPEDVARMQREMETLHRDMKLVEETHGQNVLNLVPAVGYIRKILAHVKVERYLRNCHPDVLEEFRKIVHEPELGAGGEREA